jgi:AcrR family transcriptional regulator
MSLEQVSQTTPRKRVSRRKLLDAARTLFIELGYHDTRPQDIARAAGVGHGTFYLHFADKRECFLAFVDEAADELHDCVVARTSDAGKIGEVIRGIFAACQDYSASHPGVLAAAMMDASVIGGDIQRVCLIDRWAHEWAERLQAWMDKNKIACDLDPRVIGHAIIGACSSALMGSFRDGVSNQVATDSLVRFIERGLGQKADN